MYNHCTCFSKCTSLTTHDYTPICTTTVITRLHTYNYYWFSSLQETCVCVSTHLLSLSSLWWMWLMRKRGLYLVCQSRAVSECLDEGWPGHRQPFPLEPLLQDPQCDLLCLSVTIVINDAHSTACLVISRGRRALSSECSEVVPFIGIESQLLLHSHSLYLCMCTVICDEKSA